MHSPKRDAWAAAITLFVIMAGHTVLETARDSLFLERLPITQLPWTYLSIAVMALLAAELNSRLRAYLDLRRWLAITLALGAAGSFFLQGQFRSGQPLAPHALYVWVAVVATLATGQFWLLLSELFTVSDAKRYFAPISAGGMLGAAAGGGLARMASERFDTLWLLTLGSALLALGALTAFSVHDPRGARLAVVQPPAATSKAGRDSAMRDLRGERYLRRLLGLMLLSAMVATLIDYSFKGAVSRAVDPSQLGRFFGTFNAGVSGLALLVQLVIAPSLLTHLGVGRSLIVLPALLTLASAGALVLPGLAMAVLMRGTDGGLRYSLQRTSSEVLYMPLQAEARARWKMIVDALGQRGGQALASALILLAVLLAWPGWVLGLLVTALAVIWLALSTDMERHYLALFRAKIKAGAIDTRAEVPELDLYALEALISSLGSESDDEVLASIDLLVAYERVNVIPSLLLYHPSRAVVLRTLDVLTSSKRRDFAGPARRLLASDDDEIRASAMLALTGQLAAEDLQRELASELPIAARAAILVAVLAQGLDHDGACTREIDAGCAPDAALATRLAFARALRLQRNPSGTSRLVALSEQAAPELLREVAHAMSLMPDPAFVPVLLKMLDSRVARPAARDALAAIGQPALRALSKAAADSRLPRRLRAHLPRSISRFDSARAADILLDRLDHESDGWVRFKIIRGLGHLRRHLKTRARAKRVFEHARKNLRRAVHFMNYRIATEDDHAREPLAASSGRELLLLALQEKEQHAIDRAVRLVGLLHKADVIHNIRQTLSGENQRLRAEGLELLVHRVPTDLARALVTLFDFAHGDETRLTHAAEALDMQLESVSYEERLAAMLEDDSEAVRAVAAYHVGELRLCALAQTFCRAAARTSELGLDTFARVRRQLGDELPLLDAATGLDPERRTP